MTTANDEQVGGTHYKTAQPYQHWDFVEKTNLPYMEAQIIKYISRHRNKNGPQDVQKAMHFTAKLMELRGNRYHIPPAYSNLEETVKWCRTNNLGDLETKVIVLAVNWTSVTDLAIARGLMSSMLMEYARAKEAAGEPDNAYVDQGRDPQHGAA